MTRGDWRNLGIGLLFISPWIIGFAVFTLYPVLLSGYYSFCDYDVLSSPVWVGLLNYQDMLKDGAFWQALFNTAYFAAFSLPLGMLLALVIALMLNAGVRARSAFRTFFFLPSLVPMIAVAMLWLWIFNGSFGLLNYMLGVFGIHGPNWLADAHWTKPALILTTFWGVGGSVVIYLAGLQDVPRELYESADIDGASAWHKIWHITLPIISPVIYFNLIMGIIGSLQVFAVPYAMLQGAGPGRSALFYATYIYENAFRYNQMGYASAMAWLLFIIIIVLTWAATVATRKHIFYQGK
jgi:multiple sugar transport system permease protein